MVTSSSTRSINLSTVVITVILLAIVTIITQF